VKFEEASSSNQCGEGFNWFGLWTRTVLQSRTSTQRHVLSWQVLPPGATHTG